MVLYALNAILFITQTKIRYNRNRNHLQCFLGSRIDRFKSTELSIKFSRKKFQWNQNKIFILPCAGTPLNLTEVVVTSLVKALRKLRPSKMKLEDRRPTRKKKKKKMEICEFYFLVNVCVLIFVICMRWLKPHTNDWHKKEEEIDANNWFPLSCQCSHPFMSSIVCKMRCR